MEATKDQHAKPHDSLAEVSTTGAFVRTASVFRSFITEDGEFPVQRGRYLLYVSYACPWASRCLFALALKGIKTDVIDAAVVSPVWGFTNKAVDEHRGWMFDPTYPGSTTDPLFGAATLRSVYEQAAAAGGAPAPTKFSVPLLVDTVTRRIVNNESSEILRMLPLFERFATPGTIAIDLYPEPLRPIIDQRSDLIYHAINDGVYRCGFAKSQAAYSDAVVKLFAALDQCEAWLGESRFICGPAFTEADLRLFVTILRFDAVYVVHFKCCLATIAGGSRYRNLHAWLCDVYQLSAAAAATVRLDHIRDHYYGSHTTLNPYGIVPLAFPDDWSVAHGRDTATFPLAK